MGEDGNYKNQDINFKATQSSQDMLTRAKLQLEKDFKVDGRDTHEHGKRSKQELCLLSLALSGATEHLTNEPKQTYLLVIFVMD